VVTASGEQADVTGHDRDVFAFVGRRPLLDPTATSGFRHHDQPIELLVGAGDVARWERAAGLVDHGVEVDDDRSGTHEGASEATDEVAARTIRHVPEHHRPLVRHGPVRRRGQDRQLPSPATRPARG
jgi:hypothetical protein